MKAVGLLSGGLDSAIAVKLILEQGVEVVALNFVSPFCQCNQKGKCHSIDIAKKFGIPLKIKNKGMDYLKIVRNPRYGYGSCMNPCIDCRVYVLKKAKEYAEEIGAKFIFTGEVLGQRPMSQHMKALMLIEKDAGLEGKILRPLSAKLLPETEAEKKGWVDRNKLLDMRGRGRTPQFQYAKKLEIKDYACPSGGCLLTYKEFSFKLNDLFKHKKKVMVNDIELLKVGRHFRFDKNKIIVGRDEQENKRLIKLKDKADYVFEVPGIGSPITLLQGSKKRKAIEIAARLTARYSDAKSKKVLVSYGSKKIKVLQINEKEINVLRI